jgi:hypothetical protein
MKKYALRLYESGPNPTNAPGPWPKEVIEIQFDWEAPEGTIIKTKPEYDAYLAQHKPAYDAWYVAYMASLPATQPIVQQFVIEKMPDPQPFAQPTFRTKRDATASHIEVLAGEVGEIEKILTEERYVSGGTLIVQNAEFGDWVEAYVEDPSGLIPAPYRAALCEAHPIVSTYIVKEYIECVSPGSINPGGISVHDINTYPLNAKISAGLCLSINYHAVNSGLPRKIVVNYHLTKKL